MLLITGATGYFGRHLTTALAATGRPFRALIREESDTRALAALGEVCTLVKGDVNDPESLLEAFHGVDTIIHAAAFVSFQTADRDKMQMVNGEGTANVVNMALEAGVRKVIHLSSVAVLNRRDGGPLVTLRDRWPEERPNTSYAESKFAAEREIWRGQAEGLEVAVLYPTHMLGTGNWGHDHAPKLWQMAARERGFYPTGTTGFVDVRDVAEAAMTALDRDQDGDRFLLNAVNLSWQEAMSKIAESIGAKPPSMKVSAWQSGLLWPIEMLRAGLAGTKPIITRESHQNVQADFRYDGTAYVEATGNAYRDVEQTIRYVGKRYLESVRTS
ncbi:NAD-dependent epimerase/dehydratase family protein [Neolewinella persica]|uniref:NAD-dependent epimerase/dehydratase family protein n=1 Tax=Neolewinella persica TaxID=70998 RepID=UPI0003650031|nr:NAD-dependent epimerase/dehydratase family protein [Neolewinella persica]